MSRSRQIRLTPEESVRQMFIRKLIDDYGYKIAQMKVEHPIHFGNKIFLVEDDHSKKCLHKLCLKANGDSSERPYVGDLDSPLRIRLLQTSHKTNFCLE